MSIFFTKFNLFAQSPQHVSDIDVCDYFYLIVKAIFPDPRKKRTKRAKEGKGNKEAEGS
jgi:hypothetical protein